MAPTRFLLFMALMGCAAAADPTFTPLANTAYPGAALSGLWVADQLPGSDSVNMTYLATLTFTDSPTQLSAAFFNPDVEVEEGEEAGPVSTYLRHNITSWQCADAEDFPDTPEMEGAIYVVTQGVSASDSGAAGPPAERCWVLVPSKDGKSMKSVTSRAIDSQSSEAGAYDPECPGRLRGGQILFPLVYKKVETKAFPAVANPCITKRKAARKLA